VTIAASQTSNELRSTTSTVWVPTGDRLNLTDKDEGAFQINIRCVVSGWEGGLIEFLLCEQPSGKHIHRSALAIGDADGRYGGDWVAGWSRPNREKPWLIQLAECALEKPPPPPPPAYLELFWRVTNGLEVDLHEVRLLAFAI
jgi:hypothetical protein